MNRKYNMDMKFINFNQATTIYSRTSRKRTPSGPEKVSAKRGVRLWDVKNVVLACSWEPRVRLREMSAYGRCPLAEVTLYSQVLKRVINISFLVAISIHCQADR